MEKESMNRYSFQEKIVSTKRGTLFLGTDLSLNRRVLLYRLPDHHLSSTNGLMELTHAATIKAPHFLHILDMGQDDQGFFAVLEHRQGQLLLNQLDHGHFSAWDGIHMIHKLGKGIIEAQGETIREFSLSPDNIWCSTENDLILINYWAEEGQGPSTSNLLIHLLFQLLTSKKEVPGGFAELENQLRGAMGVLPSSCIDHLIHLCHQIFLHDYNLSAFMLDLGFLIEKYGKNDKANELEIAPTPKENPDRQSLPKTPKRRFRKFRFLPITVILLFGLFAGVFLIKSSFHSNKSSSAIEPIKKEAPPTVTISAPPPKQTDKQVSAPSTSLVTVPDLRGLKQEDAEKQSLAAGIHYQYFIEPSNEPGGTVFKQDLVPGKQVPNDSKLTFWISKGN